MCSRWLAPAAAAVLALVARPTVADDVKAEGGKDNVFTLGEVSVTGQPDAEAAPTEEAVTEEQMLRFDRKTVSEAANLLPGVTVSRTGARNEATLYVRGCDVKHVPLFLDGIPIYVPYDGYPDLNRFFTYDLSEVVISKGFTSVLYGPNTMGGAINMVSMRPSKPIEATLAAGYRAGRTYDLFANVGTKQKRWYLQGSGSWEHSTGFDLSSHFDPTASEDGNRRNNSYHRDWKVSAKAAWTPNDRDEYAVSFINQSGKKGTPPYTGADPKAPVRFWQWPYWDKRSVYFTSNTALGGKSYAKARLYYDVFQNSLWAFDDAGYSTMTKPSSFKSNYDDYTLGGSVEAGTDLIPYNTLRAAFHFKDDVHRERNAEMSPIQRYEDRIYSAGVEDTLRFNRALYAVAGISYDTIDAREAQNYDSKTKVLSSFPLRRTSAWNPQGGLFCSTSDTGTIHAAVSRKSRLPSIKDRYSFRLGTALPNPDLNPEHSTNYEIGYEDAPLRKLRYKATGFLNDVKDYILQATVPDPGDSGKTLFQNQNVGRVRLIGAEAEVTVPLHRMVELGGNYTYLHTHNLTSSLKIAGLPEHKAFAYSRLTPLDGLSLLLSGEYDSKRYSSSDGVRVAAEYVVANVKLGYEPVRDLVLEVGIENVFDKNYAIDEGFPEPGRTWFGQARYRL